MKITKKELVNIILLMQIFIVLYSNLAYSYFPKLTVLSYIPDLLNIVLIPFAFSSLKHGIKKKYIGLILFIFYVCISFIWGDFKLFYVFSNGRRYLSALLIYFMSSEYLTEEYWNKGLNLILFSQGINVLLTFYQNVFMGLHPDYCNGIFGFTTYNNASQGMFSLTISIIAMVYFIDKRWSIQKVLYAIGSSCLVCAFSEVKAYYILLIFAFVIALLLRINNSEVRKKTFKFFLIMCLLFLIAYKVLEIVFPANLETFYSITKYIDYEKYGDRGGAGRLSSISYIYHNYFRNDYFQLLFGKGLGEIYNNFAYTIGKVFISFGIIGLILFYLWLVMIGLENIKKLRASSEKLINIVMIFSLIVTTIVWNAMFTPICFILFWILGSQNINCANKKIL